jgi:predicted GIY-YIG superfamily endonuclease
MIRDFDLLMGEVKSLHNQLMQMASVTRDNLGECDYPGVYLFTEEERHLYVGRTRGLRARLLQHSRPSVKDAPFAFRLARESTGRLKASYRTEGSRKALDIDPAFRQHFAEAKMRISKMAIRYVRVEDDLTQALLEIYTSTVLGSPYNEFRTT